MSVLIKGMDIPKSCLECMTSGLRTAIACAEWTEISAGEREIYRSLSCPFVELPEKHGRLIDADELKTAFPTCDNSKPILVASVRATINHMPTVIEEE